MIVALVIQPEMYTRHIVIYRIFQHQFTHTRQAVAHLVETMHYKPEGRGFDLRRAALWP
jgi:hypothetical protein